VSPDGTRLAVDLLDAFSGTIGTWLFDLPRHVSSRLTLGTSSEGYPVWAPDGARVAFASNRLGPSDLYEQNVNDQSRSAATAARVLLTSASDKYPQGWSPDGHSLVYVEHSESTGHDLWLLPISTKGKPIPLVQTPFNETQAQLSPDGRWLAYTSDETGRFEVYVRPFPGLGGKWLVSAEGGCQPRWRSDGKELFYMRGERLLSVAIEGDASLRPGIATTLFEVRVGRTSVLRWEYVVTPDAQRFLIKELVFDEAGSPIIVVLNWQTLLSR
jgi:Tol biopolymer transport system component